MSAVEHRGGLSHHSHGSVRSVSGGHALPGKSGGTAGTFSDFAHAAMRHHAGHSAGTRAGSGSGDNAVPASFGHFIGRSAGTGQCVALIYAVSPGIGSTACWGCGEPVQGNTSLRPGTVIATFDKTGRYANARDGSSHAAIYLGQDENGIQVLDQWSGSPAAVRTIRWTNPGGTPANTGSAFRVVRAG